MVLEASGVDEVADCVAGQASESQGDAAQVLCLWTWVTVLCQDIGDTSVGSGGDTCGLRLSGELR